MILAKQSDSFKNNDSSSYITQKQLLGLLDKQEDFKNELIKLFEINQEKTELVQVGNSKSLLKSLNLLDSQCEKIDIIAKIKDIHLQKMLEDEKAIFEIFNISDDSILKKNKSDLLEVETFYSAKHDILDYFSLSKFANYCRDLEYEDLISVIKDYLKNKNASNEDEKNFRLIYRNEDRKFCLRAVTSTDKYQDFGLNFSVFVALIALSKYVERTKNEIFVNNYVVDDSTIYVSFSLNDKRTINKNLTLSFDLILENDEVKRNAVSFNGVFKLTFVRNGKSNDIYLKPKGMKTDESVYPVDLLTYKHSGNINNVFEKITELPQLIDFFINQVSIDSARIAEIKNAIDVRKFLADKIKFGKNKEFKKYKSDVFNKLMGITVTNIYTLFEVFRDIEELFAHDDVISRDYWRTKLYEALIERK